MRGADDLLVVRARCCNPIRGEKIVGYITRGKGVSVHSVNCPNVTNLLYTADRRIEVEWDRGADQGGYTVDLKMAVEDRKGLLAEISAKIADVNTNITNVEAKTQDGHLDRIDMTLEIRDLKHLEKVLKSLRKVPGVLDVERAREVGDSARSKRGSESACTGSSREARSLTTVSRACTIASISTRTSFGRRATWTVARAGAGVPKNVGVDLVHRREVVHVGEVDGGLHDRVERRAGGRDDARRGSRGPAASGRGCRRRPAAPVGGSSGICPDTNRKSPARIAWE